MDLVRTLCQLVAIPSVNPMGRKEIGPDNGEARLTAHVESLWQEWGIPYQRDPVEPGRDNLISRIDGDIPPDQGGQVLLFAAHQDTVPVDGMTIEPFVPKISAGRLFGRGACDVKGGMTAMLAAAARLARQRPAGRPTLIVALTVNEEYGFSGADSLVRQWSERCDGLIPRKPDAAVVAEPTGLDVVVAHKGVLRWRVHTQGRAAHSARPEAGDNAIYKMARVVQALERYHVDSLGKSGSHPRCGPATLSVGTIRGGASVNTVPDRCTIEIDRRLMPQESPEAAYRHVIDYLAEQVPPGSVATHEPPFMRGDPLSDTDNRALAEQLSTIVGNVAGQCRQIGVPYATDAAFLAASGVPTVVFGPGSIEQAHTADEWLPLDQLEQAAEILFRLATSGVAR